MRTRASAPFELRAGALRLAVRPDLGGAVAGLWHGDTPVLRSTDPARLATARDAAVFLCFRTRAGSATGASAGAAAITRRAPTSPTPRIHSTASAGSGRGGSSRRARSSSSSSCATAATTTGRSRSARASTSRSTRRRSVRACNSSTTTRWSSRSASAGSSSFVKRSRSRIHAELAHRWDTDPTGLPTRKVAQHGIDSDVSHLDFDHSFEGWRGPARIRDERFSLQLASSLPYLGVATAPERALLLARAGEPCRERDPHGRACGARPRRARAGGDDGRLDAPRGGSALTR